MVKENQNRKKKIQKCNKTDPLTAVEFRKLNQPMKIEHNKLRFTAATTLQANSTKNETHRRI